MRQQRSKFQMKQGVKIQKNQVTQSTNRDFNSLLQTNFSGLPSGSGVKNLPASAEDMGSIPGPGRSHMLWNN